MLLLNFYAQKETIKLAYTHIHWCDCLMWLDATHLEATEHDVHCAYNKMHHELPNFALGQVIIITDHPQVTNPLHPKV